MEFPFYKQVSLAWQPNAPQLYYADNNTTITYRSKETWYTVTTDKGVTSGIASFSFRIHQLCRTNLFIGISGVSLSKQTFLGKDSQTWGLQANGALWYNRRKQIFCRALQTGDKVKLTVNFNTRTLSVTINDQFMGVAFKNLPGKGTMLMPGVSLFDTGDSVSLLSAKLCATEYTRSPLDIEYVSTESSKEESVQWLKTVPKPRRDLAETVSALGYDIHMCVLALEATHDNPEEAVEYICAHENELKHQVAHLIDSQIRANKEKDNEEKSEWFMNAFLEDEKQLMMCRQPWHCVNCSINVDYSESYCKKCNSRKPNIGM